MSTSLEANENNVPANFILAEFSLISIGRDYKVVNMQANEAYSVSILSYDGLTNNQVISLGQDVARYAN